MNYAVADEKLGSRESRKLDNHTYLKRKDKDIVVTLHATDIVTMKSNGVNILNSGGWKTVTTKDRLNKFSDVLITQRKGKWYVGGDSLFYDGIKTKDGAIVSKIVTEDKKQDRLMKQINAYCEKLKKMKTVPMPNAGDCFYCQMHEEKTGKPLGEVTNNSDHLMSHLKEKYIHGSLIYNALQSAGYNAGVIMQICNDDYSSKYSMRNNVVRAVKRYFKRQLGIAA